MAMPLITVAQVVSHVPDNGAMNVILRTSGQSPGFPVRMGYTGPADSLRIRQRPMPVRGSWGLVAFPYGDARNGIWLCSILPNLADALTSTSAGATDTDPFIDYDSQYSGFWKLIDGQGQLAMEFPDGSSLVVGASGALPTIYRHTVGANNARSKIPFTSTDRIASPPSTPFVMNLTLASGANISTDSAGNITITAGESGGGSIFINAAGTSFSGNVQVGTGATGSFTTPTGQTVTVQDGIVTNIY